MEQKTAVPGAAGAHHSEGLQAVPAQQEPTTMHVLRDTDSAFKHMSLTLAMQKKPQLSFCCFKTFPDQLLEFFCCHSSKQIKFLVFSLK